MARKVSDPSPGTRSATARRRRLPARRGTLAAGVPATAVPQQTPHEPALTPAPAAPAEPAAPARPALSWHLATGPDGVSRLEARWS